MPALVAGELDVTATRFDAGSFNTVSKGDRFKLMLDRGSEKPGHGFDDHRRQQRHVRARVPFGQ